MDSIISYFQDQTSPSVLIFLILLYLAISNIDNVLKIFRLFVPRKKQDLENLKRKLEIQKILIELEKLKDDDVKFRQETKNALKNVKELQYEDISNIQYEISEKIHLNLANFTLDS